MIQNNTLYMINTLFTNNENDYITILSLVDGIEINNVIKRIEEMNLSNTYIFELYYSDTRYILVSKEILLDILNNAKTIYNSEYEFIKTLSLMSINLIEILNNELDDLSINS